MSETYTLGISCFYHDSSATLLKNGTVVAAVEEERFTRKKHDASFPINAIEYCLEEQNITIDDINHIGFYEKPLLTLERILFQHLEMFPLSLKVFLKYIPALINEKVRIQKIIRKKLKYRKDIFFIEHHLAHAASSFLVSPFDKAAIVTVDGAGEWTTTTYGVGENNRISLKKEIKFPHSIGLLYSTITAYLGFSVNNSEYKVMGLAAYGNSDRKTNLYYKKLKQVVDVKEDGSYRLDMDYFSFHYLDRMPSTKLCVLLGGAITKKGAEMNERHKDIAAALQMLTEDILTKILQHVYRVTQCENVVLAGGVALNSVYNGKILQKTPFKKVWIQPNASDGGTSMGVAAYVYNSIFDNERTFTLEDTYLGPSFSDKEIKKFLDKEEIVYSEFKNNETLVEKTANLLVEEKVVGWFQGRMEWGPRALGARSILANPCNRNAKELLNSKVKHREEFRPFAPSVPAEDAPKYFEYSQNTMELAEYMLMTCLVKKDWLDKLPSVVHVDGSARVQIVQEDKNPLYHRLMREFEKLSGVPILINTSFNIRGEPIVCTPNDAYQCMMGTEIDCLVMGKFLVRRIDNLQDMWNSEEYAKD